MTCKAVRRWLCGVALVSVFLYLSPHMLKGGLAVVHVPGRLVALILALQTAAYARVEAEKQIKKM